MAGLIQICTVVSLWGDLLSGCSVYGGNAPMGMGSDGTMDELPAFLGNHLGAAFSVELGLLVGFCFLLELKRLIKGSLKLLRNPE